VHCRRYIQSSSPNIIPRSVISHLLFPHFLHLKSCPEKSFSAVPLPIFGFVIFSVVRTSSFMSCFV